MILNFNLSLHIGCMVDNLDIVIIQMGAAPICDFIIKYLIHQHNQVQTVKLSCGAIGLLFGHLQCLVTSCGRDQFSCHAGYTSWGVSGNM